VLVVGPYDEKFGPTEKTSTLLVDAKLRTEYDALHIAIDEAKEALLSAIRQQSGSRINFEEEISSAFTPSNNKFADAAARIKKELEKQPIQRRSLARSGQRLTSFVKVANALCARKQKR
jgi:hypothetical protein